MLNKTGRHYFICGNGQCFNGMKVSVVVHPLAAPPTSSTGEHSTPKSAAPVVLEQGLWSLLLSNLAWFGFVCWIQKMCSSDKHASFLICFLIIVSYEYSYLFWIHTPLPTQLALCLEILSSESNWKFGNSVGLEGLLQHVYINFSFIRINFDIQKLLTSSQTWKNFQRVSHTNNQCSSLKETCKLYLLVMSCFPYGVGSPLSNSGYDCFHESYANSMNA